MKKIIILQFIIIVGLIIYYNILKPLNRNSKINTTLIVFLNHNLNLLEEDEQKSKKLLEEILDDIPKGVSYEIPFEKVIEVIDEKTLKSIEKNKVNK